MKLRLATLTGRNVVPLLPDLARLCTVVFRDWPHLYDGDGRYDADHLQALAASPRSLARAGCDTQGWRHNHGADACRSA